MKKMSPQEVAEAFSSLSAEEKKFFHLHVERIGNSPKEEQPQASDASPLEETTKRGVFGGKKK